MGGNRSEHELVTKVIDFQFIGGGRFEGEQLQCVKLNVKFK